MRSSYKLCPTGLLDLTIGQPTWYNLVCLVKGVIIVVDLTLVVNIALMT